MVDLIFISMLLLYFLAGLIVWVISPGGLIADLDMLKLRLKEWLTAGR